MNPAPSFGGVSGRRDSSGKWHCSIHYPCAVRPYVDSAGCAVFEQGIREFRASVREVVGDKGGSSHNGRVPFMRSMRWTFPLGARASELKAKL